MGTVTIYSTAAQPVLLCGGSAFVGQYFLVYPQTPLTIDSLFWASALSVDAAGIFANLSVITASAGAV